MFAAGDTILFYSHQDTNTFFSSLNKEQEKFNKSLTTNKLSLNIKKTKYNLLDKSSSKDDVSLRLGDLKFANRNNEEHVKWMDHIKTVESKIAKNIGQENIVQKKLNWSFLKTIYVPCTYSYLNNANIAWASTHRQSVRTCSIKTLDQRKKRLRRAVFSNVTQEN